MLFLKRLFDFFLVPAIVAPGHFTEAVEDSKAALPREVNHQIGSLRGASHAEHGVATSEETFGNGMKDLVEGFIAHLFGTREGNKRQREPLSDDRDMAGSEQW